MGNISKQARAHLFAHSLIVSSFVMYYYYNNDYNY